MGTRAIPTPFFLKSLHKLVHLFLNILIQLICRTNELAVLREASRLPQLSSALRWCLTPSINQEIRSWGVRKRMPLHRWSCFSCKSLLHPAMAGELNKKFRHFLFIYTGTTVGNTLICIPVPFNVLSSLHLLFHCLWIPILAENVVLISILPRLFFRKHWSSADERLHQCSLTPILLASLWLFTMQR